MKIKTAVRAGASLKQHNATKSGVKIKTQIRAGKPATDAGTQPVRQHNATRLRIAR